MMRCLLVFLLLAGAARADVAAGVYPLFQTPVAGAQTGVAVTVATKLTVPAGAMCATVTVEGQPVRWYDDGTTPTAANGTVATVGTSITFFGPSMKAVQFIQTAATATISVAYYK